MQRWAFFFVCLLLVARVGVAALAVPFFRSMDAHLSSGEAALEDLVKNRIDALSEDVLLVEKDGRRLYLARDQFLLAGDLKPNEGGLLQPAFLRAKASWKSDPLPGPELPARTRFRVVQIGENFLEVRLLDPPETHGFVPIESVVLYADFAKSFRALGQAFLFHHRDRDRLVSTQNESFHLSNVEEFVPDSRRGIVMESRGSPFPVRTRVQLAQEPKDGERFQVSKLLTHGLVFWHLPNQQPRHLPNQQPLPREPGAKMAAGSTEIPSGAIYSANCGDGKLKLYSREGVFVSQQNEPFQKLDHFGDQTLPLTILHCSEGAPTIFIGSEISTDEGETFRNFIEWTALLKLISQTLANAGFEIRIAEISPLGKDDVEYTIFTGKHILKLSASSKVTPALTWKLVSWKSALDSSAL